MPQRLSFLVYIHSILRGLSKILHNAKPRQKISICQPNCLPRKMSTQITPLQPSATNEWDTADQLGGGIPSDTQRSSSWDDAGASAPADLVNGKNPSLEIEEKSEGLPTGGHEDGQPVDSGEVFQSLSQRRFIRDEYLERVQNFCDQAQDRHVGHTFQRVGDGCHSLLAIRLSEQLQKIAKK